MKILKSPWFKCIACLLAIAVISGALISTLSGLWKVTPEMRTARAITKIYGEEMEYEDKSVETEYDFGKINKIYEVGSDLLFQTTGYKGYKNGTVTVWVKAVKGAEGKYEIDKVLLESFEKQTLMGNLSNAFYEKFTLTDITEMYESGNYFYADAKGDTSLSDNNVVANATRSSTATCNAVNCVIKYLGENGGNA